MAKVAFAYDTETKQHVCTVDGNMVSGLNTFSFYDYGPDEEGKPCCGMNMGLKTKIGDMDGYMSMYANDSIEGKKAILSGAEVDKPAKGLNSLFVKSQGALDISKAFEK